MGLRCRVPSPTSAACQVLFLLYHYYEAKEVYNAIRIFIAAYVWMTGFGNFSYYYKTGDFGIGRCVAAERCQLAEGLQTLRDLGNGP